MCVRVSLPWPIMYSFPKTETGLHDSEVCVCVFVCVIFHSCCERLCMFQCPTGITWGSILTAQPEGDIRSHTHTQVKCCSGTFAEREGLLGHITSPRTRIRLFLDRQHLCRSVHSCKKSTRKIQAGLAHFKSLVPKNVGLYHEPDHVESKWQFNHWSWVSWLTGFMSNSWRGRLYQNHKTTR